jgi:uncharacterized protein (TIGR02246 family)
MNRAAWLPFALAACAGGPPLAGPPLFGDGADLVAAAIDDAWRQHIDAARRKDLDGTVAIYTDDAVYVVDGTPPVNGRAALRTMEERGMAAGDVVSARHTTEALRVDGDLAWELGTVAGDVAPKGQQAQYVVFHYVAMWRMSKDRTWRIAHLVGQVEAVVADAAAESQAVPRENG